MRIIFILIVLLSSTIVQAEPVNSSKKVLIDKLLVQVGQSAVETGKLFTNAFIDQLIMSLKKAKPDIEPKAFDIVAEEVKQVIDEAISDRGELAEMMYPIYGNRFTENELKELVAFYDTPLGQKLIRVMPTITQEGMQAGQKLGQSLGPKIKQRVMARLKSEGIEI